jgi:hypothetical protein
LRTSAGDSDLGVAARLALRRAMGSLAARSMARELRADTSCCLESSGSNDSGRDDLECQQADICNPALHAALGGVPSLLRDIWDSKFITNGGQFHERLEVRWPNTSG